MSDPIETCRYLDDVRRGRLVSRWNEEQRRYHTIDHLRYMLLRLDELASAGIVFDDEPVVLATWYHDAVYDIPGPDNERRSAQLAAAELAGRKCVDEVVRLVELTATHHVGADDPNGAALCDADLAVLAAEPADYQAYARAVREEYLAVPDDLYCAGRADVLGRLLNQPNLFHTKVGIARWEDRARDNLAGEIARLSAGDLSFRS
ncbi:hypothetical protein QSJ18_07770 [Gordonia sp. ABSL1-1]|uniref:HD domain-containing protein n=1 Tax=Gordonia sp. ABSL1-1 TaxID=3053923 RepID=UPI0025724A3C|nr:hypothetical protein [Gordonia sp. ABSL1-1]MDL9936635.1 hypothetical protein [Gordonia sp. ABSL1-1]